MRPESTPPTDATPAELWRQVIAATTDYDEHHRQGFDTPPESFASRYPGIPTEMLVPELRRLREEIVTQSRVHTGLLHADLPSSGSRYERLELIRTGGMGEIYRGIDVQCRRPVAIKKIRTEYQEDAEVRRRFHAEAELTASMEHPGIIPIYGRGSDSDGRDFYAMRLIGPDGSGTLSKAIQEFHAGLSDPRPSSDRHSTNDADALRQLARRVVDVADTVAYAHSRGIVHRDLKPSNVLIGPYGETLIADWGLARKLTPVPPPADAESVAIDPPSNAPDRMEADPPAGSSATTGVGTPGYIAPELAQGVSVVSLRSADIYSLGAILLRILNGNPLDHDDAKSSCHSALHGTEPLLAIARKAMADDLAHRYPTAEAFRDDVLNWIAGEPVTARREGWWEKSLQWPRRHRVAAAGLASATAIALLGGALFLAFQSRQKEILWKQAARLEIALAESSRLLNENRAARSTAEQARQIAVQSRDLAQRREALAFDALSRYQDLLLTSQEIFQANGFAPFHELLSKQSNEIFDAILKEFERESPPTPDSVKRLCALTHRSAVLEFGLQKPLDASALIDRTCRWLDRATANATLPAPTVKAVSLRIGELRSLQGNQAMRVGNPPRARPFLEEAIRRLEPLLDDPGLADDERFQATLGWARAVSAIATHEAILGNREASQSLQQQAMDRFGSDPPRSFDEAITRIQLHGNMAAVHQQAGRLDLALSQLELAEQAAAAASAMPRQDPGGVPFGSLNVKPETELFAVRSYIAYDRARMLMAKGDLPEAIATLEPQLRIESEALNESPIDIVAMNAYQRTASLLQTLMIQSNRSEEADQIAAAWAGLAESLLRFAPASEPHLLFLIVAQHTAGHSQDLSGRGEMASQRYAEAIRSCDLADQRRIRTASIAYQKVELQIHLFLSRSRDVPFAESKPIFLRAVEATTELQILPPKTGEELKQAILQLRRGIESLRSAGRDAEANELTDELKSKGFWKADGNG